CSTRVLCLGASSCLAVSSNFAFMASGCISGWSSSSSTPTAPSSCSLIFANATSSPPVIPGLHILDADVVQPKRLIQLAVFNAESRLVHILDADFFADRFRVGVAAERDLAKIHVGKIKVARARRIGPQFF